MSVLLGSTKVVLPAPPLAPSPSGASFTREIAPILVQRCFSCHGPEKSKGGYQLHTFERFMQGGESKEPAVRPGQPHQSKLFQLVTTQVEEDRMPQKGDPLSGAEMALIERWIREGATFDGPDAKAVLTTFIPQPPQPDPPEVYPQPIPVLALAFAPDGAELAVSGYHEITLWNPTEGQLLRRIKNVGRRTHSLAFHPAGHLLAAAGGSPGRSGEIKLFDPKTGARMKLLHASSDALLAVSFSADGQRLATGGTDNAIRIFDPFSGQQQLLIEQHSDWVMALAWSPDGALLASASRDKSARVFNSRSGELESAFLEHAMPVFGVAFSADGQTVCSAGRDRKVRFWNARDGKKSGEIAGFEEEVTRLLIEGDSIFTCAADTRVRQHQTTGSRDLVRSFDGHTDVVQALAYHAGTRRLASGSFDGEVRVWEADTGRLLSRFIAAPGYLASRNRAD